MIDKLLASAELKLRDLDCVAFGCGPGSFTGLRMAAGVIQGLALGSNLPVVSISSLAALAQGAYRTMRCQQVIAANDARMKEVYWGLYKKQQQAMVLHGREQICSPSLVEIVPHEIDSNEPIYGVGTAWVQYRDVFSKLIASRNIEILKDYYPDAKDIAWLAKIAFLNGEQLSVEDALPIYLRNNVVTAKPI